MKLESVEIYNYRAIEHLRLPLDPALTVLHGDNTCGKTSVLSAIAVGLGVIPDLLPGVSGIDFLGNDVRAGASFVRVNVTAAHWLSWKRERFGPGTPETTTHGLDQLKFELSEIVRRDREANPPLELPIVAFYDTERAVLDIPHEWRGFAGDIPPFAVRIARGGEILTLEQRAPFLRYGALDGSLTAHAKYGQLLQWFRAKEDEELREQHKRRSFEYRLKDLSAVRRAITSMLHGVSEPRIEVRPPRFVVAVKPDDESPDDESPDDESPDDEPPPVLEIGQLSGGQRAVLALAADLARRMAHGNPHLEDPLASEAVVLIDEVELHLHPSWQQRILGDLRRTFPNTQFIVSTHSPQVLTTVEPEHIVELARDEDGRIVAGATAGWTYGAESGDVLSVVMGVDERPANDFTEKLARYRRLIGDDQGESQEALALRQELQQRSRDDPALGRADVEIRRRKLFREMGEST